MLIAVRVCRSYRPAIEEAKRFQRMSLWSWMVLADAAFAVAFVALLGASLAGAALWRLRRDHRVMEAAERFEAVNLSTVIKRYVPSELQTQRSADEIAVARSVMDVRRPRWTRIGLVSVLVLLCGAAAAAYAMRQHMKVMAAARVAATPRVNLDVLKDIQGVWGWRADFLESCQENPQTVTVSPDRKRLSVHYAKPYENGKETITTLEFEVVAATPDTLELSGPIPASSDGVLGTVSIQFLDANSFSLARGDRPMGSSGSIERCPASPAAEGSVAH